MLRAVGLVVVVILITLGAAAPAQADQTQIQCPSGTVVRGICVTQVEQTKSVPGADPRAVIGQPRKCLDAGREIACFHETLGVWSDARACYMTPAKLQPAPGHPVWEARTDGLIYACTHPASPIVLLVWAPASEVVQPRVLAEQLRASMTFEPVSIGIVPEPGPDRLGLVGLPSWMWVANPGPTTLGPQSRSLGAGGVSVTLTAEVTSTRWEMGDGGVVTCRGAGTPYEDRFGAVDSPTCGYRYREQGTYTVRALTNWSAVWRSNTGEQGVFTWQVVSSTVINMGEAQALNQ